MGKKRPLGIILLSSIHFLLYVPFSLIFGAMAMSGPAPKTFFEGLCGVLLRLLIAFYPISLIISGIGLFSKQKWGRIFTMTNALIISLIMLAMSIGGMIYSSNEKQYFYAPLIISLFFIWVALYLSRPSIKEQFGVQERGMETGTGISAMLKCPKCGYQDKANQFKSGFNFWIFLILMLMPLLLPFYYFSAKDKKICPKCKIHFK